MDKNILIKAINSKGLSNSIISIYYKIGRALPFVVQRFPDGRCSEWYMSQYIEVHDVKPSGKGGQYGNAYGFLFRKGERTDAYPDNLENSWCKKEDDTPQDIPNAACGSWVLLDILGTPSVEPDKVYGINDLLESGKHKGEKLSDVIHSDWKWVKWAIESSENFLFDINEVLKERKKDKTILLPEDVFPFGKYKGQKVKSVAATDMNYLNWAANNIEDFEIDMKALTKCK